MSSGRNLLLASGRRLSYEQRPATLVYAGNEIPCTPSNLEFFEQLRADGGGFSVIKNMFVTILRADLPPGTEFKRGEQVRVRDGDSTDEFVLTVGNSNSRQSAVIQLNLQTNAA